MALPTLAQFNSIKEYINSTGETANYENWVSQYKPERKKKYVSDDPNWKIMWAIWPTTDGFTYNGKKFEQTRSMKSKEEVCQQLYQAAIVKGYTHEQMVHAAKVVLLTKRIESYRRSQNQLTYLSGLEPWLRSGAYVAWLNSDMPVEVNNSEIDDYI